MKHGSFAAAAKDVGLTQSAVSLQIKQLEQYFGQQLFDRSGRKAVPTPFAQELATTIHDAVETIEAMRFKRIASVSGRVALGTIRSVQTTTLPPALRYVREKYRQLEIRLSQGESGELLHELNAGTLDIAIVVRPQRGGSSRLKWHDLARESFVLIAPLDTTSDSAAELLQTHDWIRFDAGLTGGQIAASFVHRVAPRARSTLELVSIDAIVAMVSHGLGVSVVPKPRDPLREMYPVREISLGKSAPTRQIAFVCRATDDEDRRIVAVREAFELVYTLSEDRKDHGVARD